VGLNKNTDTSSIGQGPEPEKAVRIFIQPHCTGVEYRNVCF
jgi:hypothetical protein